MDEEVNAENLAARLIRGEFDEDLTEELRRLSAHQLEQVVNLLESSPEIED
ncbi:MAG: hypothetical protein WBW33_14420 [Bryobacteraceae bacterium]